jgi:HEAT repeat protein
MYASDSVGVESLPPRMQEQVFIEKWAARFLQAPEKFLQTIDQITDEVTYLEQVPVLVAVFPELIARKKFKELDDIVTLLERHGKEGGGFNGRADVLERCMLKVNNEEVWRLLSESIQVEPPDVRSYLIRLFIAMGTGSVPPLLRILNETDRNDVTGAVCLALAQLGRPGALGLSEALGGRGLKHGTAVHLLSVLGRVGLTETLPPIRPYLRHPEPQVRDAALQAIFGVMGAAGAEHYLAALSDPDVQNVRRAMGYLARTNSKQEFFIRTLIQTIVDSPDETEGALGDLSVITTAIAALAHYGNVQLDEDQTVSTLLVDVFDKHGQRRLQRWLRRGRRAEAVPIRLALCDALEKTGDPQAVERLENLDDEPNDRVQERMWSAALAIRTRCGPDCFPDDEEDADFDEEDEDFDEEDEDFDEEDEDFDEEDEDFDQEEDFDEDDEE